MPFADADAGYRGPLNPQHTPSPRTLERFPLGLNRDSQVARKGGVLACDSVFGDAP